MRSVIDILDLTVEEIESLIKTANDIIENLQSALEGFQELQKQLSQCVYLI